MFGLVDFLIVNNDVNDGIATSAWTPGLFVSFHSPAFMFNKFQDIFLTAPDSLCNLVSIAKSESFCYSLIRSNFTKRFFISILQKPSGRKLSISIYNSLLSSKRLFSRFSTNVRYFVK